VNRGIRTTGLVFVVAMSPLLTAEASSQATGSSVEHRLTPLHVGIIGSPWTATASGSALRWHDPWAPQEVDSSSPTGADLAGGFFVGALGGAALGLGLGFAAAYTAESNSSDEYAGLGGAIIGVSIGYVIGSAGGVWAFENRKHTRRGFGKPLLGSFLGAVVGVGVFAASGGAAFPIGVALPPIGALVGYFR
jgi:hypothetical protein